MKGKNNADLPGLPQVIVVEASAGSGKTYSLAKRYLYLLMSLHHRGEYIPLRNILAITFTNKAAVEMKERILEFLKKIALDAFLDKEEESDILGLFKVDKKCTQAKANCVMDELIRHYNFFGVQTIDSFINALLLGCALKIDRSASFTIKKNYTQTLSYCLDLVIEQAASNQDVFRLLEEFLQYYLFVENKRGWFPKDNILELMQSLFKLNNKYGELFQICREESSDVIKKRKAIYEQIKNLSLGFPEGMNGKAKKQIRAFLDKGNQILDISSLPSALGDCEPPMNKGSVLPLPFKQEWEQIREELKVLVELDAKAAYSPYLKLFRRILDFFQQVSKKEDVLFLEELNNKVRLLFDEGGVTVAELYYCLAARFSHYLIDEFQDTSVLQWRNLEIMVEEALSRGGSLFYVGDKKQAIYRFRGGEAELFDNVRSEFARFNVKSRHLPMNWRSQKVIVEFNNRVFSKQNLTCAMDASGISKELDGRDDVVNIFKDASQQYREENMHGYVGIERIEEKNQQERDEIIREKTLTLLGELRQRFKNEDIAILTRDNSEVELVTSWLLQEGYPVESEKTLNVIENPLVKEIISFLKFLHSPIDDLSFASFISGEIFSQACKISKEKIRNFLFSLRKDRRIKGNRALYRCLRQEFPEIWNEYIEEFFVSVGFVSPYELVASIYQRFKILESFRENQAFFMKLLELIKAKEEEYVGLSEFLSYLKDISPEDLYVNVARSSAVKILTVHKSKGLEFPVVIIPFLRLDIVPGAGGRGTNSYVDETAEALRFMRITKNHRIYSQHLKEIYARAYKKACIDELNKIYVALTRPQYELYIFIPQKSGLGNNKAGFFIPQDQKEFGARMNYQREKKDAQQLLLDMAPSNYKSWLGLLKDEFGDIASIKNREKILEGNIFHFILSCLGNLYEQDKKAIIKGALKSAEVRYAFISDSASMESKIMSFIDKEELRPFFYIRDGEVYQEKEVVNDFGDVKRIDRLIVKDSQVWIIDYKTTSERKKEHRKQILQYPQVIKDIYPNRKIRSFLIYFDSMEAEEVL